MSVERIIVRVGDLRVAGSGAVLVTVGVGSCVAIALYDPGTRTGGLAHALLPEPHNGRAGPPGRFARTAAALLVERMLAAGARRTSMVAWIAGGANMFPGLARAGEGLAIGMRNAVAARAAIAEAGVPLRGEAVGGTHGRSIYLPVDEGVLRVTSVLQEEVVLRA